jgi:tRNA dimethylallyltransferase
MFRRLQTLAPDTASRIDPKNGRRIVRALEVVEVTGEDFAAKLPDLTKSWQPVIEVGLNSERSHLVSRLGERAQQMWHKGLIAEVESLIPDGIREGKTSAHAIGYAQALKQLDGEYSEAEAIAETAQLTARYARRQMSWFKRDPRITWFDYQDPNSQKAIIETVRTGLSQ